MQQSNKSKRIYNLDIRRIDPKDIDYGDDSKIKSLKLPAVDLTSSFPAAFDQGALGSCVAQAFCALYGYKAQKNKNINGRAYFIIILREKYKVLLIMILVLLFLME